jgi:hypothetical protein
MRPTGPLQRRCTGHRDRFSPNVVSSIPIKSKVELSDHTIGISVSVASVALGAVAIIEKHFTLNRADGGVDSIFSMVAAVIPQFIIEIECAWRAPPGASERCAKNRFNIVALWGCKASKRGIS